jgi:hypothetical protein
MINILIIFFTQYSQRKIDLLLTISPFNQRVHGAKFFPILFVLLGNEKNREEKSF